MGAIDQAFYGVGGVVGGNTGQVISKVGDMSTDFVQSGIDQNYSQMVS